MRLWLVIVLAFFAPKAAAYTANKVWFEFRPQGGYRVFVNYTVPEIKERREAYVQFLRKSEAEKFYWDMIRGADFYPPNPKARRFLQPSKQPSPW